MSSVGTLDSRRANAQESGCQIGSPNVASTIVSAHSPPREIGRVSAQAVSGHLKWVMRALRTIQRLCARFVKSSNHATREFDVSLWPAGGRNFSKKTVRRIAPRPCAATSPSVTRKRAFLNHALSPSPLPAWDRGCRIAALTGAFTRRMCVWSGEEPVGHHAFEGRPIVRREACASKGGRFFSKGGHLLRVSLRMNRPPFVPVDVTTANAQPKLERGPMGISRAQV